MKSCWLVPCVPKAQEGGQTKREEGSNCNSAQVVIFPDSFTTLRFIIISFQNTTRAQGHEDICFLCFIKNRNIKHLLLVNGSLTNKGPDSSTQHKALAVLTLCTIFSIKSPFYDCRTLNPKTCQKHTWQNRHHAWQTWQMLVCFPPFFLGT